jgi:hypothetical protein
MGRFLSEGPWAAAPMAFKAYDAHKYAIRPVTWPEAGGWAARERRNCYLNVAETGPRP